jgi:SSS family transporter
LKGQHILLLTFSYFFLLVVIAKITGKNDSNSDFFKASKNSPWYIVAFGMIGASLSGVTFISVPGWVESSKFSYFQVCLGYIAGYIVVAFLLLPIYYRLNLTSIYQYLGQRFGKISHLTGAFFFFISRVVGAAFRMYLMAIVLQQFVFKYWGIPFELTVVISISLIWIYTNKGGIRTIVWTDTLQTLFMLFALILSIVSITNALDLTFIEFLNSKELSNYYTIFNINDFKSKDYFLKSFFGGMFITICMTGLDQDMMQKNLTCKNLKEAQKNMLWFSVILSVVTFMFLLLGALLFIYAERFDVAIPMLDNNIKTDLLFPEIALNTNLGLILSSFFVLGLIAAAYSSADSALTSLTTSFCIDILNFNNRNQNDRKNLRKKTHVFMSVVLIVVIISFKHLLNSNVIDSLLTVAGFTYGPLLGLYAFGIFTNFKVKDQMVWIVALISVILSFGISQIPSEYFGGYIIGYELLPLNGFITFIGLILIRR